MKTYPNDIINAMAVPTRTNDNGAIVAMDIHNGLTKREHFSAMAMQGMLVNGGQTEHGGKTLAPSALAFLAVNMADALIKELNR